MTSYEVCMGLSVVPVFMQVGSLNLMKVVEYQAQHTWLAFTQPLSLFIFVVSAFAETNRLPFDLPESEQELVGGYNTEYSSMKLALFFMGEYANLIAASAMMVTLFFGGWTLPCFGLDHGAEPGQWGKRVLQIGIFLVKIILFVVSVMWARWMLPRFRFDQLMDLGWRRFLPLALVNIVITAVILW